MARFSSAVAAMAAAASLLSPSVVSPALSLASTDTITWGGDNSRAGYQTTHNMDPAIVGSDQFTQIFQTQLPGNYGGQPEQIYSQPLVFTPSDGIQYVYVATTQNNVYKLDAKTGKILASRNLHIPFLQQDLDNCFDISPHVGIIGTGVIDPATETLYLTSKTYADQSAINTAQGRPNGRWYIHALDVNTLQEKPNFPINLEGTVARNSAVRVFNGGIQNQRPGLLQQGDYIYVGFGSHCVQYDFTGWVIGFHKTSAQIVERFATEGQGIDNSIRGASLWMSGGGIAADNKGSIFFATGNGYAYQLADTPVQGRNPPTSLEEAAVHMTINADGTLNPVDFFMPYEKRDLDNADKDLGTSPLVILPSQFSCGAISRVGAITGKSGKTYWLNLDDMGGYKNGPGKLDNVLQTYQNENVVYAGVGVYPLEGGYIYVNVIGFPTHVFKFSCNNGVPSWIKVADAPDSNANALGVGHGTVTSLNDQPGTGLLWTSDTQKDTLKIYNAVPQNGTLNMVKSFSIQGVTKFTRPVFGDGIVYQGTRLGLFYGFGAPTKSPLNCTAPASFGSAELGAPGSAQTVTCVALAGVTINSIGLDSTANFAIGTPSLPQSLQAGKTIQFNATFQPSQVGAVYANVLIQTNNLNSYASKTAVRLSGTGQSSNAMLTITPSTVTFQRIAVGADGGNQSVVLANDGLANLTITGVRYSLSGSAGPFVDASQIAPFQVSGVPTSIAAGSQVAMTVNFSPANTGNYSLYAVFDTPVGQQSLNVVASAGPAPVAKLEFQTSDGSGWVAYDPATPFTFGTVLEAQTRTLKFRVSNIAADGAVPLELTVSKPPLGTSSSILGAVNLVDLAEGTTLGAGESATANLYCSPPKAMWNTDPYSQSVVWTMNTNGLGFGKQFIQFQCTATAEQAAPLYANGTAQYRYLGCYQEYNPGRQLDAVLFANAQNTAASCIAACAAAGYQFCGTQWRQECWGGKTQPRLQVDDGNCNYVCSGDVNQICGGNGVGAGAGGSYISLFGANSTSRGVSSSSSSASAVVSSGTSSTSAAATVPTTTAAVVCPDDNNATYTASNGKVFQMECYVDHAGGDMSGSPVFVSSWAACVETCAATDGCVSFAWHPNPNAPCFLKNTIGTPNTDTGIWGAKIVALTSTASGISASASSAGSASASSGLFSNSTSPSTTTSSAGTVSSTASSLSLPATTSSSAAPTATAVLSCPASNNETYASFNGQTFLVECYVDHAGGDIGGPVYVSTWAACAEACSDTAGCVSFSWLPAPSGPCYLKKTIGFANPNDNVWGAKVIQLPSSSTSTSTSLAPSSSTVSSTVSSNSGIFNSSSAAPTTSSSTISSTISSDSGIFFNSSSTAPITSSSTVPSTVSFNSGIFNSSSAAPTTSSSTIYSTVSSESGSFLNSSSVTPTTSSNISSLSTSLTSLTLPTTSSSAVSGTVSTDSGIFFNSSSTVPTTSSSAVSSTVSSESGIFVNSSSATPTTSSNISSLSTSLSSSISSSSTTLPSAPTALATTSTSVSTSISLGSLNSSSSDSSTFTFTPASDNSTTTTDGSSTTSSSLLVTDSSSSFSFSFTASAAYSSAASFSSSFTTSTTSSTSTPTLTSVTSSTSTEDTESSTSSVPTSSTTSTSSVPTLSVFVNPGALGYDSVGCWSEAATGRALPNLTPTKDKTVASCIEACSGTYRYIGLEYYGRECWCGNGLGAVGVAQLDASRCSYGCDGNSTEYCGGSWALNVYNASASISLAPGPEVQETVGDWEFQGCYTDSTSARAMSSNVLMTDSMTLEMCASNCADFAFFGAEYGRECYCGNSLENGSVRSYNQDDCNMSCKGNTTEFCGAGNRLQLYKNPSVVAVV